MAYTFCQVFMQYISILVHISTKQLGYPHQNRCITNEKPSQNQNFTVDMSFSTEAGKSVLTANANVATGKPAQTPAQP